MSSRGRRQIRWEAIGKGSCLELGSFPDPNCALNNNPLYFYFHFLYLIYFISSGSGFPSLSTFFFSLSRCALIDSPEIFSFLERHIEADRLVSLAQSIRKFKNCGSRPCSEIPSVRLLCSWFCYLLIIALWIDYLWNDRHSLCILRSTGIFTYSCGWCFEYIFSCFWKKSKSASSLMMIVVWYEFRNWKRRSDHLRWLIKVVRQGKVYPSLVIHFKGRRNLLKTMEEEALTSHGDLSLLLVLPCNHPQANFSFNVSSYNTLL